MKRTDTRTPGERKASVQLRIDELRAALREAERCAAEIDIQLENEREHAAE